MEVNSGGDKNSPRPDPMYYYETPGGSKLSLWPSGTLKIEVNGSAHVRSCMEWHALAVASFARPSQQQTKPDLWWNGFRRYDERTGTYPSVSESEDTNHDIPLYSGWNAAAQSAPSPLATQTYFKGGGELGWCIHCGTPASKHELGGACIAEICAPSTPATPKGCTPLKDYIAEQERIPERKAALDEARAALASSPSSTRLAPNEHAAALFALHQHLLCTRVGEVSEQQLADLKKAEQALSAIGTPSACRCPTGYSPACPVHGEPRMRSSDGRHAGK
jgi:hypothetical protein